MTFDRPYVDRGVVDYPAALAVARDAAGRWSLAPPVLIRHGMNAIYACDDVVLRVGRASAPAAAAHQLVTVLRDSGVPTVSPVRSLAVDLDGLAVTAWERIEPVDGPVDWEAVGAAVAIVHSIPAPALPPAYPLPSPSVFPWWDFDAMLDTVSDQLDPAARRGLVDVVDSGRGWRAEVGTEPVVCHGDVHPGNVLMSARGPLLIDWDLMCLARPAWDHAMLTTFADRWGGARGVYDAFASGYGMSLVDDDLTRTLARLRNVAATLMRVAAGRIDPAAKTEADRRLRYWAGDTDAPVWTAQ